MERAISKFSAMDGSPSDRPASLHVVPLRSAQRFVNLSAITTAMLAFLWSAIGNAARPPVPGVFVLRTAEVVAAMSTRGVVIQDPQVTMLARVVASSDHAVLEVASLTRWDNFTDKAELICHSAAECLPFYVFLRWSNKESATSALQAYRSVGCSPACPAALGVPADQSAATDWTNSGDHPGSRDPEHLSIKRQLASRRLALPVVTIQAGAHSMLLIDEGGLHIRVPVTCLENGRPGKTIRVEARDKKQTYLAEVLTDNSLKGTLR
ncbi:MAG TPA: hypothetical protein VGD64_01375 [Acidisarcina sp.]